MWELYGLIKNHSKNNLLWFLGFGGMLQRQLILLFQGLFKQVITNAWEKHRL